MSQSPIQQLTESVAAIDMQFEEVAAATADKQISFLKKENEQIQSVNVVDVVSRPATVTNFENSEAKQLLVCIDKTDFSAEFYDHQNSIWNSSTASLQLPFTQKSCQLALLGNVLYAFGGEDYIKNPLKEMWSRDLSDPSSQWTARADMKQSRKWFSSAVFNDTIFAFGGIDADFHSLRSCERYSSQLNQWSTVADMNSDRYYASTAVINGCIYIAGEQRSVEKYDPETDTWSEVAPMTTQRKHFALTPFGGRLWAIGGWSCKPLSSCESYDPVTDTWREEARLKEVRYEHAAIVFNGELYVVGGNKRYGQTYVVEKYVPELGWVEDSTALETFLNPYLLILQPSCSSFFTTDSKE